MAEKKPNSFYLATDCFHLTYRGHISHERLLRLFIERGCTPVYWSCAHERGSVGYETDGQLQTVIDRSTEAGSVSSSSRTSRKRKVQAIQDATGQDTSVGVSPSLQSSARIDESSLVGSTEKNDLYDHTHFFIKLAKRFFTRNCRALDIDEVHPNIMFVKSIVHQRRIWAYHKKQGVYWQSEREPESNVFDVVKKAKSLKEAIEYAGIEIKSVSDICLIRAERTRPPDQACNHDPRSFIVKLPRHPVIFLWGPTGTGKTELALSRFVCPCFVRDLDSLKWFDPEYHDGLVFDDIKFSPEITRERCIHILDHTCIAVVRIRYIIVTIPAGFPRIFTSNLPFEETFYPDAALRRRVEVVNIPYSTFDPTFVPPEPAGAELVLEDDGAERLQLECDSELSTAQASGSIGSDGISDKEYETLLREIGEWSDCEEELGF